MLAPKVWAFRIGVKVLGVEIQVSNTLLYCGLSQTATNFDVLIIFVFDSSWISANG